MKTNTTLRFAPLAVLMLLASAARAQTPLYQITDLGTLGGGFSQAYGLNNLGQVVGESVTADGRQHPFVYSNGTMQDLGNLNKSYVAPQYDMAVAKGINDSGQVVGSYSYAYLNVSGRPVYYGGGFITNNGILSPLPSVGAGETAINNQGDAVGQNENGHASLYSQGVITDLGTLGGSSSNAVGINNSGQIAGSSLLASGAERAFIYQNGQMQALDVPSGAFSAFANGISSNGNVAGGYIDSDGFSRACFWQNGQATPLGSFARYTNSDAYAINKSGLIVGTAPVGNGNQSAFFYQNGQVYDLFAGTGWGGGIAYAVNDAGQIVGYGTHNGVQRAFLATPINNTPAPGSLLTFGAGIGAALLAARRRRRG